VQETTKKRSRKGTSNPLYPLPPSLLRVLRLVPATIPNSALVETTPPALDSNAVLPPVVVMADNKVLRVKTKKKARITRGVMRVLWELGLVARTSLRTRSREGGSG